MSDPFKPVDAQQEIREILQTIQESPEKREEFKALEALIVEVPERVYRPSAFLKKTAGPRLYKELEELQAELQTLNRSYVGESMMQALLAIRYDEWSRFLSRSFLVWGETYLALRQLKPNARDHSARHRFVRFAKEVEEVFGPLMQHKRSVHGFILLLVHRRLLFRIYNLTLEPYFHPQRMGKLPNDASLDERLLPENFPMDPIPGWEVSHQKRMNLVMELLHAPWVYDTIKPAFQQMEVLYPPHPRKPRPQDLMKIRAAELATDLQAIRPFLNQSWIDYPIPIYRREGMTLTWNWSLSGIGILEFTGTPESGSKKSEYVVDHDGLPLEFPSECRSYDHLAPEDQDHFLFLHLVTMQVLLRRLCKLWDSFYSKGGHLRSRQQKADPEAELGTLASRVAETDPEAEAGSQAEEDSEAEGGSSLGSRLKPLRFNRLCTVLQKMGVEVRPGKGSEIVLCNGTRLFTLGHHTRNPVISPYLLRSILKKLELSPEDLALHAGIT